MDWKYLEGPRILIIKIRQHNEEKKAKTRYCEEAVYWEGYEPDRERHLRTIDMLYDASTVE